MRSFMKNHYSGLCWHHDNHEQALQRLNGKRKTMS
jgi:hypothetical protein